MIDVVLTMHGNLRRFLPQGQASVRLSVPEGSTVQTLIDRVGAGHDVWLAAIAGVAVPFSRKVAAGEEIECHAPIEGG